MGVSMTTTLTLPRLAGTRFAADQLAATVVFDDEVVLDFTGCLSAAQGFCDELVKRISVVNPKCTVDVVGANERVEGYVMQALRLRGFDTTPTPADEILEP